MLVYALTSEEVGYDALGCDWEHRKKFNLKFIKPIIVHANHILKLNPNVTTICAVGVNV